jgi:hypothetical protein
MSDQEPGPTHTPYGQPSGQPDPYGQPPAGQPYGQQPYGVQPSPYGGGQPPYGGGPVTGDRRPGTVTAAGWITIVFSAITALIFGFTAMALVVARDQVITEMEKYPEFRDADIDADAAVGLLVAVMLGLVVWTIIAIVLAVLVMRRSNVARILLVISCGVTALLALLSITSGVSIVLLVAAIATIVLLFTGGAGDWFKRLPAQVGGPYGSPPADTPGSQTPSPYGNPYGSEQGQDSGPQYPPPSENPYGQRPPSDGDADGPPRDYPGR